MLLDPQRAEKHVSRRAQMIVIAILMGEPGPAQRRGQGAGGVDDIRGRPRHRAEKGRMIPQDADRAHPEGQRPRDQAGLAPRLVEQEAVGEAEHAALYREQDEAEDGQDDLREELREADGGEDLHDHGSEPADHGSRELVGDVAGEQDEAEEDEPRQDPALAFGHDRFPGSASLSFIFLPVIYSYLTDLLRSNAEDDERRLLRFSCGPPSHQSNGSTEGRCQRRRLSCLAFMRPNRSSAHFEIGAAWAKREPDHNHNSNRPSSVVGRRD